MRGEESSGEGGGRPKFHQFNEWRTQGAVPMIKDSQALDRIRDAVGHYLRREISHGEALEDVVTALEAVGRDPFAALERRRVGGESRSWAPRGRSRESAPIEGEPESLRAELTLRV